MSMAFHVRATSSGLIDIWKAIMKNRKKDRRIITDIVNICYGAILSVHHHSSLDLLENLSLKGFAIYKLTCRLAPPPMSSTSCMSFDFLEAKFLCKADIFTKPSDFDSKPISSSRVREYVFKPQNHFKSY
jgi:hypothetical protein